MKTIFSILFIHLVKYSFCQSTNDKYFEEEAWIRKYYKGDTIVYTEKVDSFLINNAIEVIKLGIISNPRFYKKKSKTRLSKDEIIYIVHELNKRKTFLWGDNLFKISRCIPNDSIRRYTIDRERINSANGYIYYDNEKNSWVKTSQYLEHIIFEFTEPIYIRSGNVMIVLYYFYSNGVEAHQELVFYKKVNDHWENWIVPLQGDW